MSSIDPDSGATVPENGSSPFPNPGETAQDYDAQAQGEVLQQYRESTKLKATITALMSGWQAIEDCMVNIPKQRDPAIAEGVNLDVVGELVGQSRVLSNGTVVSDAVYRGLIALRIARNSSQGTDPEFLEYLVYVFQTYVAGSTPFRFMDFGGMVAGIEYGGGAAPSSDQIALLEGGPLPRDMAVGVVREWYDPAEWFGFDEDTRTGAKGFGVESDPSVGGQLAMLF